MPKECSASKIFLSDLGLLALQLGHLRELKCSNAPNSSSEEYCKATIHFPTFLKEKLNLFQVINYSLYLRRDKLKHKSN